LRPSTGMQGQQQSQLVTQESPPGKQLNVIQAHLQPYDSASHAQPDSLSLPDQSHKRPPHSYHLAPSHAPKHLSSTQTSTASSREETYETGSPTRSRSSPRVQGYNGEQDTSAHASSSVPPLEGSSRRFPGYTGVHDASAHASRAVFPLEGSIVPVSIDATVPPAHHHQWGSSTQTLRPIILGRAI